MKKFVEKLIERLEEHEQYEMEYGNYHASSAYGRAIEIVNQLAEEYTSTEHINCSTDTSTGWIPCERELPKEDGYYLITIQFYHLHNPLVMGCQFEDGEWWKIDKEDKVIAWQPLPTPFVQK